MTITKSKDIITITSQSVKVYDLKKIKGELQELQSEKAPSDEELLIHAKSGAVHPYYSGERQMRILHLSEQVAYLESV